MAKASAKDAAALRAAIRPIETHSKNPVLVDQRRREVMDAAIAVIGEHGFQLATVDEIAQRAGIDKRTVYDYFDKKEDILYLILADFLLNHLERLEEVKEWEASPIERLREMVRRQIRITEDDTQMILFSYREMRYLPRADISTLLPIREAIHSQYEIVIQEAIDAGEMQPRNTRLVAHATTAMVDMISLRGHELAGVPEQEIIDLVWSTFGLLDANKGEVDVA